MRYRAIALAPVLFALVFGAAALALGDHQSSVLRIEDEVGKLAGLFGCYAAALAFERGDYLRRAWFTYGTCYALLLLNDALRFATGGELVLARGLIVLVGNASLVFGAWMLARAWSVAGLEHDEPARKRHAKLLVGAVLLSALVTGFAIVHDVRALMEGRIPSLVGVASDLGDSVFLVLVAPVMQTALAMRGGVLRWPWGLLTIGGLAWAAYDTSSGAVEALHIGPGLLLVGSEALRALANGYVCAAGAAQRLAVSPEPSSQA